jgi:hypothetical protein
MSDEQDPFQLGSSRNPSTVVADGVNQFLIGSLYGAMWGLVSGACVILSRERVLLTVAHASPQKHCEDIVG